MQRHIRSLLRVTQMPPPLCTYSDISATILMCSPALCGPDALV